MNLQIEEHIFRWLLSLELCKSSDGKKLKNSRYELTTSLTTSIETGPFIIKLLQILLKKSSSSNLSKNSLPISLSVNNFKQVASPTSRYYNWNLISESLKIMGFSLDKETVNLIVMGDLPMINDFMKDFYEFTKNSLKIVVNNSISFESGFNSSKLIDSSKLIKSLPVETKESIELLGLQIDKPLKDSESLMEFFVLDLAKSLNLKPNQAATLLTKNTKYLSNVLAKGSKGEFEPIVAFFQGFVENSDVIMKLIKSEDSKKSLMFFLQAIKAGLVSKDADVSLWTLKTYEIFIDILEVEGIYDMVYTWLVDCFGIKNLFLCLKRHPELQDDIIKVLIAFGKKQLFLLFNEKLKGVSSEPKELLFVLSRILKSLSENPLSKSQISNSGTLTNWINLSQESIMKPFDNETISSRIQAFSLLTEIWRLYPLEFQNKTSDFLNCVKSNFAFKSKLLQTFLIIELFNLLRHFLNIYGEQNNNVTIIYSLLIAFLIENFSISELRELIIHQFVEAFNSYEKPLLSQFLLLESLNIHLVSLDTKNFQWNICDFELMNTIAENDKIPIKSALIFLDLQSKIFFNHQIFARIATRPFLLISAKNKSFQQIQDFVYKFTRTSLGLFFNLHRKPSNKEKKKQKQVTSKKSLSEFSEQEQKLMKNNKKAMVIEIIRNILSISETALKNRLKTLICQIIYQMKKNINKKPNKNLISLLESIGEDPEKLITEYETDYFQKLSTMRDEEKKILEQAQQKSMDLDNISRISGESSKDLAANALTISLDLSNMQMKSKSSFRRRSVDSMERSPDSHGKAKLTKADELKMTMLRNAKIDPKLRQKLISLQENRKEKLKSLDETVKEHESKLIVRKIKLRKQVEMKNIEKGVLAPNIKDWETILLYPLDSIAKKENMKKSLELIDFELLEDFEKRLIQETFDKISLRILKKAFYFYTNARERNYKPDTFDKISIVKKRMSLTDLWSLIKDLENKEREKSAENIFSRVSNEDLLRNVKLLISKENSFDEPVMDFHQFKKIVISIAKFLFNELEIPQALRKFIEKLALLIKFKNNEKEDEISEVEAQKIMEINENLMKNPEFLIPEGFIKIKEKKMILEKKLPDALIQSKIRESFIISYEILDEILGINFGIELIEKLPKEEIKIFAKSAREKAEPKNDITSKSLMLLKDPEISTITGDIKKPILEETKKKRKLKPQILEKKEEIVKTPEELKKQEEEEKKAKELQKIEREKAKKRLEELQKSRLLYEQQMKAYWEQKHKDFLTPNEKKPAEHNKTGINALPPEEKAKKKKEFDEFNKKKLEQFKVEFQKMISAKKKEQEEYVTKSHIFSKKIQAYNEKILPKTIEEMKEKDDQKRENELLISQNFKNPEILHFFSEYESTLKALFNLLINQTYTPLNFNMERKTIPLQTLIGFANEFNICPVLFKLKHIMNFFKNITKKKPYSIDKVQVGLEYDEFLECFFRIAIKGNEFLNKMCEYLIMGGFLKPEKQEEEIEKKEEKKEENTEKQKKTKEKKLKKKEIIEKNKNLLTEKYINVTQTTENTLIALIYYLGFPLDSTDKEGTQQRFRDIISFRKIKPTKYRFLELQKKLQGEGYEMPEAKKNKGKKVKSEKIYKNEGNELNQMITEKEENENDKNKNDIKGENEQDEIRNLNVANQEIK